LLHQEKLLFYREREVGAVNTFAQWFVMGISYMVCQSVGIVFFVAPMYYLSSMRPATQYFFKFYFAVVAQMCANIYLVQGLAYVTPNAIITAVIFPGAIGALQAALCGFALLETTLPAYLSWAMKINVVFWGMNATFVNEFKNNPAAESLLTFDMLSNLYGYEATIRESLLYIVIIALATRVVSLFGMTYFSNVKI
jgi:hypothetical protein